MTSPVKDLEVLLAWISPGIINDNNLVNKYFMLSFSCEILWELPTTKVPSKSNNSLGHKAGSVGRVHNCWSWGCKFELHIGCEIT